MKISHIFTYNFEPGKLFDIPEQPVNIMLDVTNVCNNRCLYCYNPDDQAYRKDRPDSQNLRRIVSLIGQAGTKEILYLGGEPFASPVIGELLEIGKKYDIFQRAVSNGSFFMSPKICRELKERGLDEVGISFHSAQETIHDKISGKKGSFQSAFRGLENCLTTNINTFIQYSPNSLNSRDDILMLAQLIRERFDSKVRLFDINRLLPLGQGEKTRHLFLEGDDWFHHLLAATRLRDYGLSAHAELSPFCWIEQKAREHKVPSEAVKRIFNLNRGCFMWIAQLALDYKGRIKFCPAGPAVGPSILDVIWPDFWRKWEKFHEYRNFLWNPNCVDFGHNAVCKYFYQCLGGCKYSKGLHYDLDEYVQPGNQVER